jgi:hypothetical protein
MTKQDLINEIKDLQATIDFESRHGLTPSPSLPQLLKMAQDELADPAKRK